MLEETYLSNGLTIYLNEALNSMMSYKSSIINTLDLAQSKLFKYTNGLKPVQSNQVQVTGNLAVLKLEEEHGALLLHAALPHGHRRAAGIFRDSYSRLVT